MKFEPEYIERLAKIISDNELTEISLEDGEQAITIRKDLPEVITAPAPAVYTAPAQSTETSALSQVKDEPSKPAPKGKPINSPMVGTFYMAASPDAQPFVEVGSTVQEGEVVCIIEAMKLMNEIKSEYSGRIVQICVKNGDPVEYGQVLMYVE